MKKNSFLISICIPCKNRTYDLKKIMPHIIKSANASPPVEISILNYNSQDDLDDYIKTVRRTEYLAEGNILSYAKYTARPYYHLTHAQNLSSLFSKGEFIVSFLTDIIPAPDFFKFVRNSLEADKDIVWMQCSHLKGVIVCRKEEFIACGGYDERIEFYGPGDKDIDVRLHRRGAKLKKMPNRLLDSIYTSKEEKFKNYRPGVTRRQMRKLMRVFYEENQANNTLVANKGKEWGKWI